MKEKFLLMLLAIALVAGAAQANMLVNPSFEDGAGFSPDHWTHFYTEAIAQHTWVSNTAEAHSGSKYMKMYNFFKSNLTYSTSAYLGQTVDVKEGKDYYFSVWAKNGAEGLTHEAAVEVEWRNSLDNVIVSDSIYLLFTDSDWTEVDFGAFTAPEGAATAILWLVAPVGNYINAIWYDDVSMLGPDPNVHAGPDMISWDGQTVSLTGSTSLVESYSTIKWSAEPNYCAVITGGDTLTPTVQVNPIIESGPATIANHSFENGLTGWTTVSGSGHGTWNGVGADTADANYLKVYITPTDGRMCGYVDGVSDGLGQINQILANTLAANTTYTLMVDVVNDGYYEEDVDYRVQLRAGTGIPLAQDNHLHPQHHALDDYGVWETSTVTYDSGATPAKLGEPLEIRLVALVGTNEMNFDNVRLIADPPFPAYVPDVLTYTMTLEIDGDKYDTMKIDAYPDGCAAKLGAGLREATDLVGEDCITNLPDFAEMRKTWLDHNALMAPKAHVQIPVGAGEVAIDNPGFEAPHPSITDVGDYTWTLPVSGWGYLSGQPDDWIGLWWVNSDPGDIYGYGYGGSAPEGNNVAMGYNEPGYATDVGFAQVLTETLVAKTTYTLTVEVGHSAYYGMESYKVQLLAGGSPDDNEGEITEGIVLAEDPGNLTIPFDTFATSTVVYTFDPADAGLVGQNLQIRLLVPVYTGGAVWVGVDFDDVRLTAVSHFYSSPANGAYVEPASDLELGWTNMGPNKPGDPVWVDVWFGTGTEPNELDPNSEWVYDMTKIVDAVEDANSATVDVSTPGTYYWQMNSYIYGDPNVVTYDVYGTDANLLPVIEGPMWRFHAAVDVPVSVEAGDDWVTWSGQAVQLDATVVDDGASALTIAWSADPADGVVFDPNEFVEDPTVTIIAVGDPNVVTLTVSAQDAVSSDEDTMTIDVYDTACLAAIGEGEELDPGDIDQDCDTDLGDFAAIAEEWLVYTELTGSIVKP